jgi:hypothetical protein
MTLETINNKLTATFDGSSLTTVSIPTDITVEDVVLNREFTVDKPATIMLPFSKSVSDIGGAKFYTFGGVEKKGDKWEATMNEVTGSIAANTPYLVMPSETNITFNGGATLNTTGGGGQQTAQSGSYWTFKGTYEGKTWTAGDVGNDYGFAATSGKATDGVTDVEAGDFVKLAAGAWIRPMRAYLTYTGTGNPWAAPKHRAGTELPQSISVVLVSANGEVTEVNGVNGVIEVNDNSWYTLDGRKLDKQPTTKGLYINNGKKTVIK